MEIIDKLFVTNAPILASSDYLSSLSKDFGYFTEGNLVLPFYKKKKFGFSYIRCVTGVIGASTVEEETIFLNNVINYIRENQLTDLVAAPHTCALFNSVPDGSVYCPFGSYIVDLSKSEEDLFSAIHTKHKNVIRKAQKDGVIISNADEYKKQCWNLINATATRQHLGGISENEFKKLSSSPNWDFYVALFEGEPVGASLLAWSEYGSYYMHGGSAEKTHAGAMNLLHWTARLNMKKRGVKRYDFVGARINPIPCSKQEGIQRFKSRFGGELKTGYLWKYPISPVKVKLYDIYIYLKNYLRHSYTKDIIDQENSNNQNRRSL